ncbi:MAG TPA: DUF2065 domain-containing protein [Thiotrichaceae bacterium]|nr:DUF2065 domain-containing protein [Thiotrichaceae bacterium]HIM08483.1 DUF2065 domain-containing protein [Gammaproteobacteria bacterium]
MNFSDLLTAIALVFVIEGLTPFINPDAIRKVFLMASQMDNQTLRFLGFTSMMVGLILLYVVR